MAPDAEKHNPRPDYLAELTSRTGRSKVKCAALLGVPLRTFHHHLRSGAAPYTFQFALEVLANESGRR